MTHEELEMLAEAIAIRLPDTSRSGRQGWLSVNGAANYSDFSPSAIEKAIAGGKLKSLLIRLRGNRSSRRIRCEWLDEWLEAHAVDPTGEGHMQSSPLDQLGESGARFSKAMAAAERFHELVGKLEKKVAELDAKYIPLAQVRRYCGYDRQTIYAACKAGDIESFAPNGGKRVVLRSSLDAWI